MNPNVVLALISDLYSQNAALLERIGQLESELADKTGEAHE